MIVSGSTISFHDTNPDTIRDSAGKFEEAGFRIGDQATVIGTAQKANSGTFEIAEVTSDQLTLVEIARLNDEPAGANITVQVGSVALAFWLFTAICLASLIFGLTIMPETKGRTLEEIGASWQRKKGGSNETHQPS